ncbi:carbohydrate ABC transporter permease [Cellulomonas dongxiuzhuiae]|uniref:carbohydrate ABC transporter permease n=1 Tax=Cellulomonas dongxiuzhuiae TaxID=2819979 RepID=UPI001AAE80F8|nr:carbohydrate ABC transporter permease [Cellulomonas dongxiuzhuiae]MBO3088265.1 carbohydrate ABC transporter permease [Cellulomonas dongxiuzhuiae]
MTAGVENWTVGTSARRPVGARVQRRLEVGGRYLVLLLASAAVLAPVFWMLSSALRPSDELFVVPVRLLPDTFTFEAFVQVWVETGLARNVLNSLLVVTGSTAVAVVFTSLSAYGLSRYEFRGKGTFLTFLLVTQMFPAIMLLIPYFQIVRSIGLYDSYGALIITYTAFAVPFCTWMLYGYMKSIPRDLDEAAMLDGCSPFGAFWRIVLPLARPGVIATAIFSFITGWNEYIFALALVNSQDLRTLPVMLGLLAGNDALDWNAIMAASVVAVVPMIIIFGFFQRHLVSGLGAGAVKG